MQNLLNKFIIKSAPVLKHAPIKKDSKDVRHAELKFQAASEAEIKALGDIPDGYIAGWASTNSIDSYGHVVETGAFSESIEKRGLQGPQSIKLLIGHKWDKIGGTIKKLEYRGDRLWIEAQMELGIGYVNEAYLAAKAVGGTNFSVGFFIRDYEWKGADGKEVLHITKGDLFEVSVVAFPGNEECTMEFLKDAGSESLPSLAQFEKALVAKGLVKGRNDAQNISTLFKGVFDELQKSLVEKGLVATDEEAESVTQVVKENLQLFTKGESVPTAKPALNLAALNETLEKMSETRKALEKSIEQLTSTKGD